MSKVYLNHPRIAGFPTLAFHFCPISTRIRLSWAQDLNFKPNDRAIMTKSPPAVEWHRAVLVVQITPCRGPWGHFTRNSGKLIRLTESACSGDTIYLLCIKSLDISRDSVARKTLLVSCSVRCHLSLQITVLLGANFSETFFACCMCAVNSTFWLLILLNIVHWFYFSSSLVLLWQLTVLLGAKSVQFIVRSLNFCS